VRGHVAASRHRSDKGGEARQASRVLELSQGQAAKAKATPTVSSPFLLMYGHVRCVNIEAFGGV
jgi:hypothetical protein